MTPGFQVAVSRLEGQWRNLFRRIHRIQRSAAILCFYFDLSLAGLVLLNPLGRDFQASYPECVGLFTVIYPSETFSRSCGVSEG